MRVEAMVLMALALAGCATPKVTPRFEVSWNQALEVCDLQKPSLTERLAQWSLDDAQSCVRAQRLGWQLQCLSHEIPELGRKHAAVTPASVMAFQSCLQPLAASLSEGAIGRSSELALVVQQCIRPLELAWSAPVKPSPWTWPPVLRWFPEAPAVEPVLLVELPPMPGPTWARCEALRQLRPAAGRTVSPSSVPQPSSPLPVLPQRPLNRLPTQGDVVLDAPPPAAL